MSQPLPKALRVVQISRYIILLYFLLYIIVYFVLIPHEDKFRQLEALAIDSQDNIYISDLGNSIVRKFDTQGNSLTTWGSEGSQDGQFASLSAGKIAVGPQNEVYVLDGQNHRVQKFNQNGKFLAKWGSAGKGPGQFDYPSSIAVDSQGQVYIWDNNAVQKFDSSSNFLDILKDGLTDKDRISGWENLTTDASNNVYVSGTSNGQDSIFGFDSQGQLLKSLDNSRG